MIQSPEECNPIEGNFALAKIAYGFNNIKAELKQTSESWIASIALVLNLVAMTRQALVFLIEYNYYMLKTVGLKFIGNCNRVNFLKIVPRLSY